MEVVNFIKEINKTRVRKGGKDGKQAHAGWNDPQSVTHIIVHHTATNSYNISSNTEQQILNYSRFHANRNYYSRALQYGFFIPMDDGSGDDRIWQCLDLHERTYHCNNDPISMRSVSVTVDGSYNLMEFTELQKKKLEFIIDYIQERTGGNKKVSWHRAVGTRSTDCPGKNIIAYLGKYLNGFRVGYDKPADTREGHYYKKENNKFVEVTDKDIEGKIIKVTRQEIKPVSEELEGVKSKIKQGEREILDLRQVTIGNDKATQWLDKVYIEVLNRYVDSNGWKAHRVLGEKAVREILIQSKEREELIKLAQQYPEQVDALDTLYMEVFKRPSDLAARRQYISDGNLDLEAVRVALLNSREYNTRADGRLDNNPNYNVI